MAESAFPGRLAISFRCDACDGRAKIVVDDNRVERVFCPACSATVAGDDARLMYTTLRDRRIEQAARRHMRGIINESSLGRVPLTKVEKEFRDARWPFVLEVEVDE